MKTDQIKLLKRETSDSLWNIRRMLVDQNEKLFSSVSSYSNCARIYDETSQEFKDWKRQYRAKCKRVYAEMRGIDSEILEVDKLLNDRGDLDMRKLI